MNDKARMIAAAPDMLRALEGAREFMSRALCGADMNAPDDRAEAGLPEYRAVLAAITKARGPLKKFRVEVCRTSHSFVTIEVEAEDRHQAALKACDAAGDVVFPSANSSEYDANHIEEVGT